MTPREIERQAIRAAVLAAAKASRWTCDDGHKHRRPEAFSMYRLQQEVNRRNPGNLWYSASIACGVFDLLQAGELEYDPNESLRMRVAAA